MDVKNSEELEFQIREVILKVLKDFDISNYDVEIKFNVIEKFCKICLKKEEIYITIGYMKKFNFLTIDFNSKLLETIPNGTLIMSADHKIYKSYNIDDFFDFLDSEFVQLLKVLRDNKGLLRVELGNIMN